VTGVLAILFALTTINLGRIPSSTSQAATYDVLISDIRSQQIKAMTGNSGFGIHFDSGSYTLTPQNFVVNLDPGLTFTGVSYASGNLNFAALSGDGVDGSLTITNSQTGSTTAVNINKYGATY